MKAVILAGGYGTRISEETGIKVNPFFASDYAGIIEAIRAFNLHPDA